MIDRPEYRQKIMTALRRSPVSAILGPRQCGKTTLAKIIEKEFSKVFFFDLEDPEVLAQLENPKLTFERLNGLIVIDEIQRLPALFPLLRVLVDRPDSPAKFLLLGSASPELIKQSSESLAGRIEFIEVAPFDLTETGTDHWRSLWIRGGMPRSYLAEKEEDSVAWRENFIRTFLEKDIPALGISLPPATLRKFWIMIAHYHGQIWNASEIGRSLGLSDHTVKRYLDLLTETFLVRQLPPWFVNIKKRQVKAPKIYIRDSGLLHTLLRMPTEDDVIRHPKCGASWEGFALEQIARLMKTQEMYFWAAHSGAEIDLLADKGSKRYAFEFKYSDAPRTTKSMQSVLELFSPEHLFVVYPGTKLFPLDEKITAVGVDALRSVIETLG